MGLERVVITGMGFINPLSIIDGQRLGVNGLWENIRAMTDNQSS